MKVSSFLTILLLSSFIGLWADDHSGKPLKGLLVTGGGHHDYGFQQNVIMEGISQRLPVKWTVMFDMDPRESKSKLSKEGWADGFDFVFYKFSSSLLIHLQVQHARFRLVT